MKFRKLIIAIAFWGPLFGIQVNSSNAHITQTDSLLTQRKTLNKVNAPLSLNGTWFSLSSGLTNAVNAIAIVGSDVYVGGKFINAGGIANADKIARWDGSSWHALGSGLNGDVEAIAVSGSDIYVGGRFVNAGGISTGDKIARWDGSNWHAVGSGLSTTNTVYAIAASGSDVYIGGQFANAGGIQEADMIVRWDGSNWHALGNGLRHELGASVVRAIAVSGSNVFAGGNFTNAGGESNADYIARWDGSNWYALGSGITTYPTSVSAIAVDGSDVYVGGSFVNAGGNQDADTFALWDGSNWHGLGFIWFGNVYAISVDGDNVYVGGSFTDAIKRWDGSTWHSLDSGLASGQNVWAIATDENNVYVGGEFNNIGGVTNGDKIARWEKATELLGYKIYLPTILR